MRPIIPTLMKRVRAGDFDVNWAYLRRSHGDWHPLTGEIRLHWNVAHPVRIFIHEALHDMFPNAKERWIWQRTYGVEGRLTKKQRKDILKYLQKTMRKNGLVDRRLTTTIFRGE